MPGPRNPGVGMDGAAGGSGWGGKPQKNAVETVGGWLVNRQLPRKRGAAESARVLVPVLVRLIPALNVQLNKKFGKASQRLAIGKVREVLASLTDDADLKKEAKEGNLDVEEYVRTLLRWAQRCCGVVSGDKALKLAVKIQDDHIRIESRLLHAAGLFPERWQVPLSKSSLQRNNSASGGQHVAPQQQEETKKKRVEKRQQGKAPVPSPAASRKSREERQVEAVMARVVDRVESSMESDTARPAKVRGQKKRKALQEEEEVEEEEQEAAPARPSSAKLKGKGKRKYLEGQQRQQALGRPQSAGDSEGSGLHSGKRQRRRVEKEAAMVGAAAAAAAHPDTGADADGPSVPRTTFSARPSDHSSNFNTNAAVVSKDHCYWLNRTGAYEQVVRGPDASNLARKKGDSLTSCHDCQGKHIQHLCNSCGKSYCQPCCRHYEYLLSAGPWDPRHEARELFCTGTCPCCIGICVRKLCIKKISKKDVPPPKLSSEEERLMAIHVVARLTDSVQKMLDVSEKEALRQGMKLNEVDHKNNENFRILCNRCATTLDVLYAHCEPCDIDLCPACCSDIMGDNPGPVTCPICKASKTSLHCQLTRVQIRQLRSAPVVLERVQEQKSPAVNSYDFERKLWRPLAAPARNPGPSGSRSGSRPAVTAANGTQLTSVGEVLANGVANGFAKVFRPSVPLIAAPAVPGWDPSLANWHRNLPSQDYRKASNRSDGIQNFIWTPHVGDFSPKSPRHVETMQQFVERWGAGEPIVVRGMRGRMNWGPDILTRAARDMKKGEVNLDVIDCSDWENFLSESTAKFFKQYKKCHGQTTDAEGNPLTMLKLKDFPPDALFRERCQRHNDDFTEIVNSCMPLYLHPSLGVLNLAGMLPQRFIPPDLGPKGYIAYGREEECECEGDSVTRLHLDLSDAINIVCHVQRPPTQDMNAVPPARCGDAEPQLPGYGGAGALWDLFRREDMATLRKFLLDAASDKGVEGCPPFFYKGKRLHVSSITDVIHDQSFMLTASHRAVLRDRYGIQPWTIEQYEGEGVIIPSRCPHQVRNLRACIKIALDTVSPESVDHCMILRDDMRVLAQKERPEDQLKEENDVGERHFHDKLQVGNMAMFSLAKAVRVLSRGLDGNIEISE